jgi:HxlR-like helix-turn-helix
LVESLGVEADRTHQEGATSIRRVSTDAGTSYNLTDAGRDLFPLIQGMGEWGQRWARSEYRPEDLDPGLLLWDVRRFLHPGGLGPERVVVQLTFPSMPAKRRYFWIVVDDQDVDLCLTDPGFDVDVTVEADLRTLTEVWMGDGRFVDALADGLITMQGPTELTRRMPSWFGQHPVLAEVARGS